MNHGKIDGFETVMGVIDAARRLGTRRMADGTELVGRAPHVAPEAWLHVVFAPLAKPQLKDVENQIERVLPADCASFLTRANGVALFSDALSLYGLRTSFLRTGVAAWQPYSIRTPNVRNVRVARTTWRCSSVGTRTARCCTWRRTDGGYIGARDTRRSP